MTTVSKDLMRHAKKLVAIKWAQGDDACFKPDRPDGHCVGIACVDASFAIFGEEKSVGVARDAVLLFKHANGIDALMSIAEWNDAPERTKVEVLAAFDIAINASAAQVPGAPRGPRDPNKPRKKRTPRGTS